MENNKIFVNRKMENNPFFMAPVEIIVPFYGEQASVAKLMTSIFNTVHTNRYLITLVDDGSINDSFIKDIDRKKIPGVRCFRNDKSMGFGAAINMALKTPRNKDISWITIMHSDVFVEDNHWLSSLGESMNILKTQGVKMIAPTTNNSLSQLSELTGSKGERKDDFILEDGYLPMYCVLAHRQLFEKVGYLKEYPYAGCEAEEFAIRMKSMGYKQAVCGSSWVNHKGEGTLEKLKKNNKVQGILRKVKEDFNSEFKNNISEQ